MYKSREAKDEFYEVLLMSLAAWGNSLTLWMMKVKKE
jgi:hypothetical protein